MNEGKKNNLCSLYRRHILTDKMKPTPAAHGRTLLNDLKSHGSESSFIRMRNNGLSKDPKTSRTTHGKPHRELMSPTSLKPSASIMTFWSKDSVMHPYLISAKEEGVWG
uniref:Uncharacterized protein n=1 Tax=Lepeophtheirus salmonis TaxID=72036 RepID=A0A0K2TDC0_LEPSM